MASCAMKNVFLNWHLGNSFGWGILGLNLFCQWANDRDVCPLMGQPITREAFGIADPLRVGRAYAAIEHSNRFLADVRLDDGKRRIDAIVIDALGNDFSPSNAYGARNIGRCIFEATNPPPMREALGKYDALLVASQWNADLLEHATGRRPKIVFEGVDTSIFCPGSKSGFMDPDKFYVFSGGKIEFRKGQDLVLLAFGKFAQTRDDCVLVTAWQSIWPHLSAGFKGRLAHAVERGKDGMLDIHKWACQNGIAPQSIVDVGLVPNPLMASVLREMDVSLQPSRAEACTNLPAKEAMACAIPVIAAVNTGMRDLLRDDNCIPLKRQHPVVHGDPASTQGWGESDVDEMVAALEFAYQRRQDAKRIGTRSREWLLEHDRTWQAHARDVKAWILST
jgi:glycosyltransferase involved in cell wall biosynthesis